MIACGRRFGKTVFGENRLVEPALRGFPVAWFSPTYKMLDEVWRDATTVFKPVTLRSNATSKRIELITGGVIDFWSLTKFDAIRGRKYKRCIADEVAMVPIFGDAWQFVIRPTLTDYKGDAFFLSTPKGRNWFCEAYERGADPLNKDWRSWSMPTVANPFIDPQEVEDARLELPELTFEQEYLARFHENAGGVFRYVKRACTGESIEPYYGSFVMGVDWGQQHDFTVLKIFDCVTRREVFCDRFNKIDWKFQRDRLESVVLKWRPWLILAEANSIGGPNIEELQREGLPVVPFWMGPQNKSPLIESYSLSIERQEVTLLNDRVSIAELEAYEVHINKMTGRRSYSAPSGAHDDTVIAGALADWACVHQREFLPEAPPQELCDPVSIG